MADAGIPWERYLAALRRRRTVIAACVLGALAMGLLATRFFRPTFEVRSTIWLAGAAEAGRRPQVGQSERLLGAEAWGEVLRSYAVLDPVVIRLALFVVPDRAEDSTAFAGFRSAGSIVAGEYALRVSADGVSYTLEDEEGRVIERGAVGDSIGKSRGFGWAPDRTSIPGGSSLAFTVLHPRQASIKLRDRLEVGIPDTSFLSVRMTGAQPVRDAAILNEVGRQFIATTASLISGSQSESSGQLRAQLGEAEVRLRASEEALRLYRTGTVGLPSQDNPATGARDPAAGAFFEQREQFQSLAEDRRALERALAQRGPGGAVDRAALLAIPSVREAPELTATFSDLTRAESALEALRRTYTDEYRPVQELRAEILRIESQTLPALSAAVVDRLRNRERSLASRVSGSGTLLRSAPTRAIELQRREREVETNEATYNALRVQYDGARLSEVASVPGVSVLDSAVAPLDPVTNTFFGILLASLLGGVAIAVGLALLLDTMDKRLWYPEQLSELGLEILGGVPIVRGASSEAADPIAAAQVVEAFRALRLELLHAVGGRRPIRLAVLSAEPGDGKSFVAAHLARAFARAGFRTLLVDADVRRGALDERFRSERTPGLIDALAGDASLEDATHATQDELLSLVPSGTRLPDAPELLSSDAVPVFLESASAHFDAIIVDTAPICAGVDGASMAVAAGNAVYVTRVGKTDRRVARVRLATLDRLPLRLLGVVLNGIRADGMFRDYAYQPEYAAGASGPNATSERGIASVLQGD